MSYGRASALTARRAPCPTCHVKRWEYCVGPDGEPAGHSHPARVAAARDVPDPTAAQLEVLQRLHVDPSRHIEPIMRRALLRRGLIKPSAEPGPVPDHQRRRGGRRSGWRR